MPSDIERLSAGFVWIMVAGSVMFFTVPWLEEGLVPLLPLVLFGLWYIWPAAVKFFTKRRALRDTETSDLDQELRDLLNNR